MADKKIDDYVEYDEDWNLVTGFKAIRAKINYRLMNLAGSLAFQPSYGRRFQPFDLVGSVDVEMDIQSIMKELGFETRVRLVQENRICLVDLDVTI